MNRIFTILLAIGLMGPAAYAQTGKQATLAHMIELLEQQQEEIRQLRGQLEELNYQIHQLRKDGEMAFLDQSAIKAPVKATKNLVDTSPKSKEVNEPLQDLADHSDESSKVKKVAKKTEEEKPQPKVEAKNNKPKVTKDLVDETSVEKDTKELTTDLADTSSKSSEQAPEANSSIVYNEARTLLDQKRFAEAEVALTQFIKKYPKDPMIVNAYYWLAETQYIRSDYTQAALKFGEAYEAYQKHKNSSYKEAAVSKGPEIIFKLASSLYNIGKYDEAKVVLGELYKEFPKDKNGNSKLPPNIRQQSEKLSREIARKANKA